MRVVERGKRISFHMPFNIGNCVRQGTFRFYCKRWIWKRTYHLADKWESKQSSHYAYEYVARDGVCSSMRRHSDSADERPRTRSRLPIFSR